MNILVAANASFSGGTGHVVRTLRLASQLDAHGVSTMLLTRSTPEARALQPDSRTRTRWIHDGVTEATALAAAVCEESPDLVVLDLGEQPTVDAAARRALGVPVVVLDDLSEARLQAALVVQTLRPDPEPGRVRAAGVPLLEGPEWMMVDPHVRRLRPSEPDPARVARRALVSLGGTDPNSLGGALATAVRDAGVDVTLVLGPAAATPPPLDGVEVVRNPRDFLARVANTDAVIASGALTLHESLALGVPTAVLPQNDHQASLARAFAQRGAAIDLTSAGGRVREWPSQTADAAVRTLLYDPAARQSLAVNGHKLVDGRGLERVAAALVRLCRRHPIPSTEELMRLVQ